MRTALLTAAILLLAVACSGDSQQRKPYSALDLAWIKQLQTWNDRYARQTEKLQPVYDRLLASQGDIGSLRRALRPYGQCAASFRAAVRGRPDHAQLRRARMLVGKACEEDRKLASLLLRTRSPFAGDAESTFARMSDKSFAQAFELIAAGLLANRPLPVRDGLTDDSRVERRLSEAARTLTLQDIEVRCWSPRDWPAVLKEWNAYSGGRGDAGGFVTGATRAHIAPSFCETVARFLYDDWRPADDAGEQDLADALALVAHEIEHLYETHAGEAAIECYAAQDMRRLAGLLGASSSYASRLATVYWQDVYPTQPAAYRSRGCRKDGPYDRHPETSVFP